MKLQYEAPRRGRINYNFMGFEAIGGGWWWAYEHKKWVQSTEKKPSSSHRGCRTVKAFKRMLKTAPSGVKFRLCSRWVGYDVYGYGQAEHNNSSNNF